MIRKTWDVGSKYYDSKFDIASNNMWDIFVREKLPFDSEIFKKRFGYSPIVTKKDEAWVGYRSTETQWTGLFFKNEAEYFLFLLEWYH